MCDQKIRDGELVCIVKGDHGTHVFQSSSGMWADAEDGGEE